MLTIADEPEYLYRIRAELYYLHFHTSKRPSYKQKTIWAARDIQRVADRIRPLTWINERDKVVIKSITAVVKEGYIKVNQLAASYETISTRVKHQVKLEPLRQSIQYLRNVITELKEEFNL